MFRAVHDRCFVDFTKLHLPLTTSETIDLLSKKGFRILEIDMIDEARTFIGKVSFRLGVRMSETPKIFDCSSFIKWLFGRKGIWLPRFAIQQFEFSTLVPSTEIQRNDLVFTAGYSKKAWYVGHVSLYTGSSIITAMIQPGESGVMEKSLESLLYQRAFRGIGRIIPSHNNTATVITPPQYEVETSDDVRHLVLSWIS